MSGVMGGSEGRELEDDRGKQRHEDGDACGERRRNTASRTRRELVGRRKQEDLDKNREPDCQSILKLEKVNRLRNCNSMSCLWT